MRLFLIGDNLLEHNLRRSLALIDDNQGPTAVIVICGTEADRAFWQRRFELTKSNIFRADGGTDVFAVSERVPKGNFLGTLAAWHEFLSHGTSGHEPPRQGVAFMTMLFGTGSRLSPFTQALGNSKPRFPTPFKVADTNVYLTIGELAALYSGLLLDHLHDHAFHGLVVKWGDEVLIPSVDWRALDDDYADVDAVRFVWQTAPTAELALQKEWILFDTRTNLMLSQIPRQPLDALNASAAAFASAADVGLAVNLGSLAVTYDFLEAAARVFDEDVRDPRQAMDWDPAVWLALTCRDRSRWHHEIEREAAAGQSTLRDLDARAPQFFDKVCRAREIVEERKGRELRIKVLDFGEPLWLDLGQHVALRENFEQLLEDSPRGHLLRTLFHLPTERDARGNTIVDSTVPPDADIQESLILDSTIRDPASVLRRAIIIGGDHDTVHIPDGGIALFSRVGTLTCDANCVAFRAVAPELSLPKGGRHATVVAPDAIYQMTANEDLPSFKGENYTTPILDNLLSFEEAGRLAEQVPPESLDDVLQKLAASEG